MGKPISTMFSAEVKKQGLKMINLLCSGHRFSRTCFTVFWNTFSLKVIYMIVLKIMVHLIFGTLFYFPS